MSAYSCHANSFDSATTHTRTHTIHHYLAHISGVIFTFDQTACYAQNRDLKLADNVITSTLIRTETEHNRSGHFRIGVLCDAMRARASARRRQPGRATHRRYEDDTLSLTHPLQRAFCESRKRYSKRPLHAQCDTYHIIFIRYSFVCECVAVCGSVSQYTSLCAVHASVAGDHIKSNTGAS